MPYFTYCLQSDEGYHYTGHTQNLDKRILNHSLKTTHYTKKGTNWRVVYSKEFEDRAEAMKHEKWLKSGVGREWLKKNIVGWSPPKAE
jgi:putative endonuclease